ncbi:BlaI/MecI/CopY family transcriptional regulator [Haliscomenobacter sp.]|uniref:BlaI/MecI/CopY family transcriptional regulator n=1 Tax=Haliscomenobacter sp. TaxID=2717303 RepID=UPI003BAB1106
MKTNEIPQPTEAELEILTVLWEQGPATVREVNDKLNERRSKEMGYTTTLKLLQIMFEKGLVTRNADARTHIYSAAMAQTDVQRNMLQRLVDTAFQGSAMQMVMQALGDHDASTEELQEIKALIEKVEKLKS